MFIRFSFVLASLIRPFSFFSVCVSHVPVARFIFNRGRNTPSESIDGRRRVSLWARNTFICPDWVDPTTSPNILPGNAGSRRQIGRGERSREPGKNARLGLSILHTIIG